MKFKTKRYIVKRKHAFQFAFYGIQELVKESHFRIHVLAAGMVLIMAIVLRINVLEWVFCVLSIGLVLFSEAMNSAIETICDLVMPQRHPMVKRIKDIAAGAVLISSVTAAMVGLIIFVPKLYLWVREFFLLVK
ncbi:diacylglycerol kinase family protein [Schleiferia thermophila]|jgi:diacylglycerol kinase|uniref:Undecaprenol kinase/diacylglycerol kinase (ATP) n=1 Tax=Schleiferia thermophila TaxID=884107 RepID=A0A369AB37_9FLAO|nr:diacylglycerol kinase family protein [Schleiferia thermophila]KFD39892.1 DeoR family transcriptional regulator [Schleiferia thermophila str. Yellowstone]RCX05287.1 undecaprenol kinase/diacylglycerol kinase (ATP) [Schleiferia thermophila]GCD79203.1 diacylglycerol kinase [Schleiferia thermophila]